jgi:hypothetical protein
VKDLLFLLPVCFACALRAADVSTLKLIQTIPLPGVKGRFDHLAIDVNGQRLFVAALGNNTLEVIDVAAGKRLKSAGPMSKPTGVLYLPDKNEILVANGNDGTLKVLNGSDYKIIQTVRGLDDADNVRLDAGLKQVWLGYGDGALAVVSAAPGKSLEPIKLPGHPESFQLEPNSDRIFVNVPDAKQIAVVDRKTRVVLGHWRMEKFQANFPMSLDTTHQRLFIGCRKPARLVVFDTAVGKPLADAEISGDTDDLFYDASRKRLYVSCGEGFVDTIEQSGPDTYHRISKMPTAAGARTSVFSPELNRFYLAVPERGSEGAEIRVYEAQ